MRPYECRKVPALRYLLKLSPELTLIITPVCVSIECTLCNVHCVLQTACRPALCTAARDC